jgi:hypothetical protein
MTMKTEEEMHQVRCCGTDGCGERRMKNKRYYRFCIGSACAAWRFGPLRATVTPLRSEKPEPFITEDPRSYAALPDLWSVEYLPRLGYCGLAGKDQV